MRSNQNLSVFWKTVNPQDCVSENLYRIIMKTTLQERVIIHCSIANLVHKFILMPQAKKILQQRQQWIRNGRNWKRFRRGTWRKSEVRKKWSMIQGRRAQEFILPHWWTCVIWRMPNWRQKHQKYKGRVVLRGDTVKDDSGSYAVFTVQGSSASQMTAAIVMDIISRLPGCDGQAADAVSANTQVKMEDAPTFLKIPKSECPDNWIRLPKHKWPKSWSSREDSVVLLERNLYCHPLAGLLWERQFEKILLKYGLEKVPNWDCLFVHRHQGLFLSVYVDDVKLARKSQNINPMWKVLNKEFDLGEPTSFLDHVYLGCTQRQCEISKDIVDNYRTMFESRISAGGVEKLPFPQNLRISSWSYDMAGHAKKCVERYCELANKTTQQLYKVSTPCIDDHHFKEEEMKSVGELSHVCSQIVLKCLYLARIGRPDILWSVNKLARSITKWTKACDKRLNRLISKFHHTCEYKQYCHVGNACTWHELDDLIFCGQWTNLHDRSRNGPRLVTNDLCRLISYIHHTCEYKQYCYVGNTAKQCRLGLFSRLRFYGRSWGIKIHFWRNIVHFLEVIHLFQ